VIPLVTLASSGLTARAIRSGGASATEAATWHPCRFYRRRRRSGGGLISSHCLDPQSSRSRLSNLTPESMELCVLNRQWIWYFVKCTRVIIQSPSVWKMDRDTNFCEPTLTPNPDSSLQRFAPGRFQSPGPQAQHFRTRAFRPWHGAPRRGDGALRQEGQEEHAGGRAGRGEAPAEDPAARGAFRAARAPRSEGDGDGSTCAQAFRQCA